MSNEIVCNSKNKLLNCKYKISKKQKEFFDNYKLDSVYSCIKGILDYNDICEYSLDIYNSVSGAYLGSVYLDGKNSVKRTHINLDDTFCLIKEKGKELYAIDNMLNEFITAEIYSK